ncbi:GNAT family N-acetyltransferase [Thalassotalea ponticola]|uniref:GNAT family N-acetyltransferase n=1 Tax=Thalassotalea ponticola TaxID=1523392 RepID=UPI0025B54463|nr:GNAT family N-acetyltransferase [Thalassotalea ponticola]MDN3651432.1 GNAT family N-acetyltransferase [Thalassotalea ponticola]
MSYHISEVSWQQAKRQLKAVREKVFVCEHRIPPHVEFDSLDQEAFHVLVTDKSTKEPLATGRITKHGEISRICVVMSQRKSPIGKDVIQALLSIAHRNQLKQVFINSSLDAVDYFTRHNFISIGDVFMEAGLPRQRMCCDLVEIDFKRFYLSH